MIIYCLVSVLGLLVNQHLFVHQCAVLKSVVVCSFGVCVSRSPSCLQVMMTCCYAQRQCLSRCPAMSVHPPLSSPEQQHSLITHRAIPPGPTPSPQWGRQLHHLTSLHPKRVVQSAVSLLRGWCKQTKQQRWTLPFRATGQLLHHRLAERVVSWGLLKGVLQRGRRPYRKANDFFLVPSYYPPPASASE